MTIWPGRFAACACSLLPTLGVLCPVMPEVTLPTEQSGNFVQCSHEEDLLLRYLLTLHEDCGEAGAHWP